MARRLLQKVCQHSFLVKHSSSIFWREANVVKENWITVLICCVASSSPSYDKYFRVWSDDNIENYFHLSSSSQSTAKRTQKRCETPILKKKKQNPKYLIFSTLAYCGNVSNGPNARVYITNISIVQ